jgi:cytoskeleton protein RodZ
MAFSATVGNGDAASTQVPRQDPPVAPAASGTAEIAARNSESTATAANPVSKPPQPAGALETLKVEATGESWVDVQDAGGQRRVYGLLERGDSRRVTGRPPFAITIGDTTRVMLRHDGARVDLGP